MEDGLRPYGATDGSDIDSVSLATGKLNINIPLISFPQRGGKLKLEYSLHWRNLTAKQTELCDPNNNCTYTAIVTQTPTLYMATNNDIWSIGPSLIAGQIRYYTALMPDYSTRQFGPIDQTYTTWESLDATGMRYDSNAMVLTDSAGVRYTLKNTSGGSATSLIEDTDGNQMTHGPTGVTDTLGRVIPVPAATTDYSGCTASRPIVSATTWTVPGPNGAETFKFCYANVDFSFTLEAPNGGLNIPGHGNSNQIESIVLPNLTTWTFQYDSTYGSLSSITLPTGGTISYTVNAGLPICQTDTYPKNNSFSLHTRSVDDGNGPRTWTYPNMGGLWSQVTVNDPLGNDTVHTMTPLQGSASNYETKVQYYQGLQAANNLLKTVDTTYNSVYSFIDFATPCHAVLSVTPASITTTWNTKNTVSKVTKSYDPGVNGYTYGKVVNETVYDYGVGAPGPALRTVHTQYQALVNGQYLTNNLLDLPSQVTVFHGTAPVTVNDCTTFMVAEVACTKYGYDETGLDPASVNLQHNPTPPAGANRGNQTSASRWLNPGNTYLTSTARFYDTGTVHTSTDPLLNKTTFTYDTTLGGPFPTATQLPTTGSTLHVTHKTYDSNTGLVTSATDENSQVTNYHYDAMRRITEVDHPDGGADTITRQETTAPFSATLTRSISSSLDIDTTDVFDGLGRTTQTQLTSDPEGTTYTDFTYDALGRKATVSNPYRTTSDPTYGITTYNYDALGRTTQVIPPDGTQGNNYVATAYCDATSTLVTDQADHWRRSTTDGLGRLIEVDEPNSLTATVDACPANGDPVWATTYSSDALGNLLSVVQGGSHNRSFVYDSLSRMTSSTNPEAGLVSYTYDADGNVHTKTDARGGGYAITYNYDALNRLTSKTYANGDPTVTYYYDQTTNNHGFTVSNGIGRRTSMTEAAGSEWWSYDKMGREAAELRTTNGVTLGTSYAYNYDGSLATLTYPSGRVLYYGQGQAGRPLSVADQANNIGYAQLASYAPQGALSALTLGSASGFAGIKLSDIYNNRLQPCRVFASTVTPLPSTCTDTANIGNILDLKYDFNDTNRYDPGDNNGNVVSIFNNRDITRSQYFLYDQVNRISRANTLYKTGANCWGETFTYDQWANMTSIGAVSGYSTCTQESLSVTADAATNRINSTGFLYDSSGNMTADGINNYAWNAESEMKSAAGVNYTYDGDGNRVQKSNGKIYWYGAGSEVLDESDAGGNITDEYVYFGGKRIAHRAIAGGVSTYYYYIEDFLGSSRVITNSSGGVCYDADFYPFGGERTVTNTCAQNYKFTGKERDTETGNDDFGARSYSSSMGRWLSADWSAVPAPIPYANLTNPQTLNLYAMVGDNPETFADLDGHYFSGNLAVDAYVLFQRAEDKGDQGHAQTQEQSGQVQALVDAQNGALANSTYAPNTPTAGTTHCSEAACNIAQHMGTNTTGVLSDAKGNNYPANTQINNLANPKNGYHPVTPDQAQALGNKGVLVFATQHGAIHGHIASVRPEGVSGDNPRGRSGPLLANVGLFNGVAHQSAVFTPAHGAIVYYAPNQ